MIGRFQIDRTLLNHDLWLSEPFTRGQAWVDLIGLANFTEGYIFKRGIKVTINRGFVGVNQETLAIRWKWSRGKVVRFLSMLKKENMIKIEQQKNCITSLISIINYDKYQFISTTNETANNTASGSANKTGNRTPNETGDEAAKEAANETPSGTGDKAAKETANETPNGTGDEAAKETANGTGYNKNNNVNNVNKNNDNTSKRSASLFFVDEVKDIVIQNQPWVEAVSRRLGIDVQTVRILVADFSDHLHTIGVSKKSERDFKSHFSNWARKVASQKKGFPEPRAQNIEATPGRQSSILSKLLQDDETRLGQNLS